MKIFKKTIMKSYIKIKLIVILSSFLIITSCKIPDIGLKTDNITTPKYFKNSSDSINIASIN